MMSGANPQTTASRPVVVDASVWLSWLITGDANNARATRWLKAHTANDGEMIAPSLLLTEVAAVIKRTTGSTPDALRFVKTLEDFSQLTVVGMTDLLIAEATSIAARYGLRAADAVYVATAKRLNVPLVTFDQEQSKNPLGYIVAVVPR